MSDLYRKIHQVKKTAEEAKELSEASMHEAEETRREIKNTQGLMNSLEEANAIPPKGSREGKSHDSKSIPDQLIRTGFTDKNHTMLAVAAGTSMEDNLKYNIYYDPAKRTHSTPFKYIGLYKYWEIAAIGVVKKIVYCDYDEKLDKLNATSHQSEFDSLTKEEIDRIKSVIKTTSYYDLNTGNKFFIVEKFCQSKYPLKYPIMGKQYFWLNELPGFHPDMDAQQLAEFLGNLKAEE